MSRVVVLLPPPSLVPTVRVGRNIAAVCVPRTVLPESLPASSLLDVKTPLLTSLLEALGVPELVSVVVAAVRGTMESPIVNSAVAEKAEPTWVRKAWMYTGGSEEKTMFKAMPTSADKTT